MPKGSNIFFNDPIPTPPLPNYDGFSNNGHYNVIMEQPRMIPFRQWRDNLCDCMTDKRSCLCITFCAPCYLCHMYNRYGEGPCAAMNPVSVIVLRAFHRGRERIQGTMCEDCLIGTCCSLCTICQIERDMKYCEDIRGYLDV